MFERMLLLRGLRTNNFLFHHMKTVHGGQPQNAFLAPPLIVSALKRSRF
jgi:hypothetical protein